MICAVYKVRGEFYFLYFMIYCTLVSNAKGNIAKSNKSNFGTVCHTEVYLTFSRLGAKLSGTIAKFRGCSLKIKC